MSTAAELTLPAAAEIPETAWQKVEEVRCRVTAEISVHGFTVRDLLLLQKDLVINTRQPTRSRIAVCANGSPVAASEFEVFGEHLGVRLAEVG